MLMYRQYEFRGAQGCASVKVKWQLSLLVLLCTVWPSVHGAPPWRVIVSVPPQKYFVERIGGDRVQVVVVAGPGQNPHLYEPSMRQMMELSGCDAYFRIGMDFEPALARRLSAQRRPIRMIDAKAGVALLPTPQAGVAKQQDSHMHETLGEQEHEYGAFDPHIWTDPLIVRQMAARIAAEMSLWDSEHRDFYQTNLRQFQADLDTLYRDITATLAPVKNRNLLVFHPAWTYFAARFELNQISVEAHGKQTSAKTLAAVIDFAKTHGIKIVFAQRQFSPAQARYIATAIGGKVIMVDELAEDYMDNMRRVALALAGAMQ